MGLSGVINALRLVWTLSLLYSSVRGRTVAEYHQLQCGDPGAPPRDGYRLGGSAPFAVGAGVSYGCRLGYLLRGQRRLQCLQDPTAGDAVARWNGQAPQCMPLRRPWSIGRTMSHSIRRRTTGCTDFGDLENGYRTFLRTDSIVTFGCDCGFELEGANGLECRQREWNGTWPRCVPTTAAENAMCGDPGHIFRLFGSRFVEGTSEGSVVTYSCISGMVLRGSDVRICLSSGEWSGRLPTCQVVNCRQPDRPVNGDFVHSHFGYGTTVVYSCHDGHVLEGEREVKCLENSTWSSGPPVCRAVRCPTLRDPPHGSVSHSTPALLGAEARYLCDTGYGIVGQDTRVCLANGTWSGEKPTCEHGRCDELQRPEHGEINVTGFEVGADVSYACFLGYNLIGVTRRKCQESGRWTDSAPHCAPIICSNISVLPNVLYSQTNGNSVFSVTTYSCHGGYVLLGSRERECQALGVWSGQIPACFAIVCPSLSLPENGNYTLTDWRCYRSEAVYTCNEGYTLYGGDTIRTCQKSMTWSGREPCCVRESNECDPLPDIDNGSVQTDSSDPGAVATYVCDEGFMLAGDSQRVCSEGGVWSNSEPTCVVRNTGRCGQLTNPSNGDVVISTTEVGGVAKYSCDAGYQLSGNGTRICLNTGMWSGNDPTCEPVDCGNLVAPGNGNVVVDMTTFGGVAIYMCDRIYKLVGMDSRQCQSNGSWTGEAPVCEAIQCGTLPLPANGAVDANGGSSVGTIANYTCNPPYKLVGMDSRRCQDNGTWTGQAPSCEVIIACSILDEPQFGVIVYDSEDRVAGSNASYSCNPRYTLIGASERRCLENMTWSGVAPTCELLECPTLGDPLNGMVAVVNNTPGGVVFYLCNAGFMLDGERSRVCERVGERELKWSGDAPNCESIKCPILDNPANGKVSTPPPYFVNVTAVYICNAGFELRNGSIRRVCMADGTWSGSAPLCVLSRIFCPANLAAPEFGSVMIVGDGTLGSLAVYSCDLGYEVVGEQERECELDGLVGEWSGDVPTCRAVMCLPLEEPVDGFLRITGLSVSAVTLYFCDSGFEANGPVRRQCLPTGQWDGNETVCDPRIGTVSCGRLQDPDNGLVALTSTVPGSMATYSCSLGYMLVNGGRERRCQGNGTWDGTEPSCNVVNCGRLTDPVNGMVLVQDTELGAMATYLCAPGHVLVGLRDGVRFCTLTGTWSKMDPTCDRIDCGSLSPPVNGVVDQLRGTRFMDETFYTCLEGYVLTPPESQTRTCTETGDWDGTDPTCELRAIVVDCGDLTSPRNGFLSLLNSSTGEGSLAEYGCRPGYMLVGGVVRRCQRNGRWSGAPPTCVVRECPSLQAPENGAVFVVGTTVNSSATYICDSGFLLVGLVRRVCQNNGEWTGQDTQCLRREDVMCPPLAPPTNGSVDSGEARGVGSTVTYDCGAGFVLDGPQQRICQTNGAWSGADPTCERMQCPDPGVPADGRRLGDSFQVGSSVLFVCSDGFELDGMVTLTCLDDGTWSHATPTCILPVTLGSRRSRRGSCSGDGEEVLTEIGERCRCVAGQLESCCRYRQEWSQLSPEQRMRYIAAVTTASSDPQYHPIYVGIMQLYLRAFESVVLNNDPETSQFFPWHRYYLHLYEDLLRVIDRSVTVPYWDWTMHSEKPYDSDVFDPILGFGGSADNVTLCVNSGPFQQREFAMTPQTGGGCIRRMYGDFPFFNRQLITRILALPASSFSDFHSTLQLFFHFPIRCFIGGTMCTNFASEDPVYLLLLTQLDRLLTVWQSSDEERALVRYSLDTSPLVHTMEDPGMLKVSDYSSNDRLPYGAAVCYSEEPALTPLTATEPEK